VARRVKTSAKGGDPDVEKRLGSSIRTLSKKAREKTFSIERGVVPEKKL